MAAAAAARGGLVLALLLWGAGPAPLLASDADGAPPAAPAPAGTGAPAAHGDEAGPQDAADHVLVRVNGVPIMASELDRLVAARVPAVTGHGTLSPERMAAHRKELLQELVVRQLELQEARREGLSVTEEEVDAAQAKLVARFPNRAAYEHGLAAQGLDPAKVREGLRDHLLGGKVEQKVRDRVARPTRDQLVAYYNEHPEKFHIPARAEVSYLMFKVDPSAPQSDWNRAKERAQALADRARGGEPFDRLDGGEGVERVDLGRVHQGQAEVAEIDRAAFAEGAGEVVGPVWTLYGYALVHVDGREPGRQLKFEDLNLDLFEREWLKARWTEALKDWTSDLMARAELKFGG